MIIFDFLASSKTDFFSMSVNWWTKGKNLTAVRVKPRLKRRFVHTTQNSSNFIARFLYRNSNFRPPIFLQSSLIGQLAVKKFRALNDRISWWILADKIKNYRTNCRTLLTNLKRHWYVTAQKITGENNRFISKFTGKLKVISLVNLWKNDREMTDKMTGKTGIGNLLISCSNQCSISGSLILF